MKKLLLLLACFVCLSGYSQLLVNVYGTITGGMKQVSGTTLSDLKGSANGTLTNSPTANTNGFIHFVGDHGATAGNRQCVLIATRTTFQYTNATPFTWVTIWRSTKNSANQHNIANCQDAAATISLTCNSRLDATNNYSTSILRCSSAGNPLKISTSTTAYNDGMWHVEVTTFDGTGNGIMTHYIDGHLIANGTNSNFASGNLYTANSKMVLGASYSSTGSNYSYDLSGDIAVFQTANAVITGANIADINNEFNCLQ